MAISLYASEPGTLREMNTDLRPHPIGVAARVA
jgi:hypothetical protein